MNVTIEETLASSDFTTALTYAPYLLYSEILEGARRPLVFMQVVKEMKDLMGKNATSMKFLTASQLGASKSTEASMLGSGMNASDKNLGAVTVSVSDVIWCAVELSDFIVEDYPEVNVVQAHMQNMTQGVMEYLDAYVYSVLKGASGTMTHNCASLDYDELVDCITEAKETDVYGTPYLIVAPAVTGELLKDDTFLASERYTTADIAKMVEGEAGKYAGTIVLESSLLTGTTDAYLVFPSQDGNPVVALLYKRTMKTVSQYVAQNGYTYFNTSCRATPSVVQPSYVMKINMSVTP